MKLYSSSFFVSILILESTFALPLALANGLGGQRLEKNVGQYVVDIGTDQEFTPQAGAPILFDFNLLSGATRQSLPFTDVDVSITLNEKPLVNSDIAYAKSGPTLLTYAFPEGGSYTLQTTFFAKDERLADTNFTLSIGGSSFPSSGSGADTTRYLIFGGILGIFLGVIIGVFVSRAFRARTSS